jgi:group I intron endonuclease
MKLYVITNRSNGKRYVGITSVSVQRRWNAHVQGARAGERRALCAAIRKYGPEMFEVEEAGSAETWESLCEKERAMIAEFKTLGPGGYNQTAGGDGTVDLPVDIRERIAASNRGRRHTADALRRIGAASKGHPVLPEVRAKLSKAHLGKKLSVEHRAKLSAAKIGKKLPHTPEHAAKIAEGLRRAWARRKAATNG